MSVDAALEESPWRRLTQIAFILVVAVVISRLTTVETLRDPWDVAPGSAPVARGAGPATGLVLDLLAILPALLVLARRTLDRDFRLTPRWSHLPMLQLGGWVLLSGCWSADKFGAIVPAMHLLAGFALLWAVSQLVRGWVRLRIVASVAFGMLLVITVQSVVYKAIDVPANIRYWNENRAQLLREHGWEAGSFSATQLEHKITSGEVVGFFTSPNTFAAVGVMLLFVSIGVGWQKVKDGDGPAWLAVPAIAAGCAGWIIVEAKSKTAGATPLLGLAVLVAVAMFRSQLQRRATGLYWLGVAAVFGAIVAVAGHGVYHGGLFPGHFSNSLDFRWKYWVAAVRVFREHPLTGVGWNNFGLHYLGARLPEASEEVKDPHNFLLRIFVETGLVGGVLVVAWLMRLWWEATRPARADVEQPSAEPCPSATIGSAVLLVVVGILLGVVANVDFTQSAADVLLELMRRALYLLVLLLGTVAATMLSPHKRELDARPAPWLVYGTLVALGLFLIHNLIDFSLFEVGPMYAFLLLAGAVLGVAPSTSNEKRSSRAWALLALAGGSVAWVIFAAALVAPVAAAEQSAFDANEEIRTIATADQSDQSQLHYARATRDLRAALDRVPYNADYAFRAARAAFGSGDVNLANQLLTTAIRINPLYIDAYLLRANIALHSLQPDAAAVRADFETILRLNPNDVGFHTHYGEALERFGHHDAARQQYELALKYDAALPAGEPKRLSAEQLADLQARVRRNQSQ